ncbi:MAG TPA: ATP-binding protein, partial [Candidatus Angelobacter sp.]
MNKRVSFKTNTLLKNLVGKDLINDDSIAVVELVKNAYDASSDSVLIRLEGLSDHGTTTDESRLMIADKGIGMDDADIRDKWLNIAYSDKKLAPKLHGAYFAGNKGIGRFSCDRLGAQLDMFTRKAGGDIYHLKISWPDFEIEGKKDLTIQQIKVPLRTVTADEVKAISEAKMSHRGTILLIS